MKREVYKNDSITFLKCQFGGPLDDLVRGVFPSFRAPGNLWTADKGISSAKSRLKEMAKL